MVYAGESIVRYAGEMLVPDQPLRARYFMIEACMPRGVTLIASGLTICLQAGEEIGVR